MGGHDRDLLEELVTTEMALTWCPARAELCPKLTKNLPFAEKGIIEHKWSVADMRSTPES